MEDAASPVPTEKAPQVSLTPALLVWRGESQSERIAINVVNTGDTENDYAVEIQGLDSSWYSINPRIRVASGRTFQTELTLHPPQGLRHGDYPFTVVVSLDGAAGVAGEAPGWLSVPASVSTTQAAPVQQPRPAPSSPPSDLVTPPDVLLAPRTAFRFGPGEISAQAMVTVHNRSKVADRYRLWIEGLPDSWHVLSSEEVRLEPGANAQVPLRLTPRTGAGMPAGDYEFHVRAAPHSLPESYGEAVGLISIVGVSTFDARLQPVQAEGRKKTFTLSVMNTGDLPLAFDVEASDPEARCRFRLPTQRELEPGQEVNLSIPVGAKRIGIVGPPETFDFHLRVRPEGGAARALRAYDARFVHKPLVGFRLPFIVGFMLVLAAITIGIVFLAKPVVDHGITWVGCQLDGKYRFSINSGGFTKPQCKGGRPYNDQLQDWQRGLQSSPFDRQPGNEGVLVISPRALNAATSARRTRSARLRGLNG
jgi:hypothetical protein